MCQQKTILPSHRSPKLLESSQITATVTHHQIPLKQTGSHREIEFKERRKKEEKEKKKGGEKKKKNEKKNMFFKEKKRDKYA